jgi:hypothetical protein
MEFDLFGLSVKDLSTRNVITRCTSLGPLYMMCLPSHPAPSLSMSAPSALVASASTWNQCLGHPSVNVLSKLSHDSSVVVSSNSRAHNNFDLIYCDLWTSPIVSITGYKYYLVILDDHSHFVWTFLLRVKSDTFPLCQFFHLCFHTVWPHYQSRPV